MKVKFLLITFILFLLFSCQSGNEEKKTEENKVEMPEEVTQLKLPDGWDDEIFNQLSSGEAVEKPIMAVVDFESNVELALNVNDIGLTDMLTNALYNTQKFDLVERDRIQSVFNEQSLADSDDFAYTNAAQIGELLGASYILTGKITSAYRDIQDKFSHYELTASITLTIRAIDTTTGKIYKSVEANGTDTAILVVDDRGNVIQGPAEFQTATVEQDGSVYTLTGVKMSKQFVGASKQAVRVLAKKLEATFPLLGYVLNNNDGTIMTDVGSARGARKGDFFIVIRLGNEITHPATGKVIGREKQVVGSAVIESVGTNESYAKIVKLKAEDSNPANGDVVLSISREFQYKE